jgi:hypothetical protein
MKPESPPSLFLSSCDGKTETVVRVLEQGLQRPSVGARKSERIISLIPDEEIDGVGTASEGPFRGLQVLVATQQSVAE